MSHLFAFLIGAFFTPVIFILYAVYTANINFDDICDYGDCEPETKPIVSRTPQNHETLPTKEKSTLPSPEELSLW